MGEIGPVPSGCGENRGPRRLGVPAKRSLLRGVKGQVFVAGVEIRPYFIHALDGGPATAFGLGFVWPGFRPQRHPPR
jgi:hypothetical protein